MQQAPTGSVTLVFTDVEGSTARWEAQGEAFQAQLDLHDAILRDAIDGSRGYEVKTEGDAFMVAFDTPEQAMGFCREAQAGLAELDWEGPPLRVRMGVHSGRPLCRPDPLHGRMDYFGPVVNRAARICAAAHGGQVVVSGRSAGALDGAGLRSLGTHALRGVVGEVELFQLGPGSFGPLRTHRVRRTNLPAEPDRYVGRQSEIRGVVDRLAGARLVTLLGPGGAGKTRLAIQAAREVQAAGVWWVDLTEARSEEGICRAVAGVLEVEVRGDPVERLGSVLAARGPTLLVLDNCEPCVESARVVVRRWLAAAAELTVLATSRVALALQGEARHVLDPLGDEDGLALFVERARGVVDPADPALAQLLARLDGLPLAIELAAARTGLLTVGQLLARLEERFSLLGGARSARAKTLRAVIDDSWALLPDGAGQALAQLSIFEGTFSADAVEGVVEVEGEEALDLLELLVDHSLVRALEGPVPRFALLDTLRAYASEQLRVAGTAAIEEVGLRHATHYACLGAIGALEVFPTGHGTHRSPLARELDNLVAAGWRALAAERADLAAPLVRAAWSVFYLRGPYAEGEALLRAVLDLPDLPPQHDYGLRRGLVVACAVQSKYSEALERIQALLDDAIATGDRRAEGWFAGDRASFVREQGGLDESEPQYLRALEIALEIGDPTLEGNILGNLGVLANARGQPDEAAAHYERAFAVLSHHGSIRSAATVLANLANLRADQGRIEEARAHYHESERLRERIGDHARIAMNRTNLAQLEFEQGNTRLARGMLEEALETHTALGGGGFLGLTLANLAGVELAEGRPAEARLHLERSREVFRAVRWELELQVVAGMLGEVARQEGRFDDAQEGLEQAERALREVGSSHELAMVLANRAALVAQLGDEDLSASLLEEAEAIADRLGATERSPLRVRVAQVRAR